MVDDTPKYIGFWPRAGAVVIDVLVFAGLSAMGTIFIAASMVFFGLLLGTSFLDFMDRYEDIFDLLDGLAGLFISISVAALLESSNLQATLGKLAIGAKVTDLDGNKITFKRAFGRNCAKIISFLLLLIGFMLAGWTRKKQALHDMMAGTTVVKGRNI